MVADPDEVERHEPRQCGGCGHDLAGCPEAAVERRQVFDLPPMAVRVTEHQLVARRCGCGATTGAAAPEGVTAPVQYRPRITAIVLYLYVGQFLSKKRAAQAMAELFGTPVSEGTVSAMTERAADGLGGFLGRLGDRIAQAEVAGFDETGLRVAGKLHWVHCARTGKYTLITCHPKRGRTGIDDAGVLARFTGVAVHDAWAPYDTYPDPGHQLCCAHALRELQGVADLAAPESDWCWAGQAADALVAIQNLVADAVAAGASTLDEDALATQLHLYRCAAHIGITETAARGGTRAPALLTCGPVTWADGYSVTRGSAWKAGTGGSETMELFTAYAGYFVALLGDGELAQHQPGAVGEHRHQMGGGGFRAQGATQGLSVECDRHQPSRIQPGRMRGEVGAQPAVQVVGIHA
jgi:transposase